MKVQRIFNLSFQNFESQFSKISFFVPNLLRFRRNPTTFRGIYVDDSLVGTFVLLPYSQITKFGKLKILRIERPLILTHLRNKQRAKVIAILKEYVTELAISLSCDFIEMELYDQILDTIFFPSSLSTIGSFNLTQDYESLVDSSFEEIKTTFCYELINDESLSSIPKKKHSFFKRRKKSLDRWGILNFELNSDNLLYLQSTIPFFAFNFPEYTLINNSLKSERIQWFPNLFSLSANNWRLLMGDKDEIHKQVLNITEGKIYRISGFRMNTFLSKIQDFWKIYPFSSLNKIQIFTDEYSLDLLRRYNGRAVHRLRLHRKNLR